MQLIHHIGFYLIAAVGSEAQSPLPQLQKEADTLFQSLAQQFGTTPMAVQLGIAIAAGVSAILLLGLMVLQHRPQDGASHAGSLFDRIDHLEIALREAAGMHLSSEVKGVIGYFKQEVAELRALTQGMNTLLSAIEQELQQVRAALVSQQQNALAKPPPQPANTTVVREQDTPPIRGGAPLLSRPFNKVSFTEAKPAR